VPRYLSQAWVEEFNAALDGRTFDGPGPDAGIAAQSGAFTVAQEVRGAPDGDVVLLLEVQDGALHLDRVTLGAGGDGDATTGVRPDVTIVLTYDDAAAMATGSLTPAEALTAGRIRVRGDLSVLVAGQEMLGAAHRALPSIGEGTTY
jgi:putative sterol carrier protein